MAGVEDILDGSVKFSMMRGDKVIDYTRAQMLSFMQKNHDIEQNCTVTTSEMESDYNTTVVKVDMKYNGFVRSNFVTITNTGKGWKITNVYTVFK